MWVGTPSIWASSPVTRRTAAARSSASLFGSALATIRVLPRWPRNWPPSARPARVSNAGWVRELSDETVRGSGEARGHQVRRVLGRSQPTARIVLLIDDAHTLHHQTLRALKRLPELSWLDVSPLLGSVLLGQADRAGSIPEGGLRSDHVPLGGPDAWEAAAALEAALEEAAEDEAGRGGEIRHAV